MGTDWPNLLVRTARWLDDTLPYDPDDPEYAQVRYRNMTEGACCPGGKMGSELFDKAARDLDETLPEVEPDEDGYPGESETQDEDDGIQGGE